MKRSEMIARALLGAALLLPLFGGAAGAAEREWCEDDPLFVVDGAQFRLTTSWDAAAHVSSVSYVLDVPSNARAATADPGRRSAPEQVTISRTLPPTSGHTFTVVAHVTVNGTAGFDDRTEVWGPKNPKTTYSGTTGRATVITLTLASAAAK